MLPPLATPPGTRRQGRLHLGWLPACLLATGLLASLPGQAESFWSLRPPVRPPVPAVADPAWPRGDLDRFVLSRLEREGLIPAPEADRATLLRRVSLDLQGLPPSPEELAAFLADPAPDAYERAVDRLLASPHHGERMAQMWLDLARYTDTNGFDFDSDRQMWAWRDWVVRAFATDMPYDQFTMAQIAGDLMPQATVDQRVATAFHRNHAINAEGEGQPGEYLHQYVADRTATFATTWLGLSIGCAECHDHKFDPISQRDYYGLYAFWNQMPEKGLVETDNAAPTLELPTAEQGTELLVLERQIAELDASLRHQLDMRQPAVQAWLQSLTARGADHQERSSVPELGMHFGLEGTDDAGARVEGLGQVSTAAGVRGNALHFDGRDAFVQLGQRGLLDADESFTVSAWVRLETKDRPTPYAVVGKIDEAQDGRGWLVSIQGDKLSAALVGGKKDSLRITARDRLAYGRWHHVALVYTGSREASGLSLWIDGVPAETKPQKPPPADEKPKRLVGEIGNDGNLRIGGTDGQPFRGCIDEVRIEPRALDRQELAALVKRDLAAMVGTETAELATRLFLWHEAEDLQVLGRQRNDAVAKRAKLLAAVPVVSVTTEMSMPRATHVLLRGDFLRPGERVQPAIPTALGALPAEAPQNRLGLAQWLVRPDNPLVARVHVNRLWRWFFGQGLVETLDDFGTRGERPSHPELLDWLARDFVDAGFGHRRLVRLLVTSATYRQSSHSRPELLTNDPDNRLLGRAGRWRLDAEALRDQALTLGGLLDRKVGGPSVMPWQPEDLWPEASPVADRHRRGLYTATKRSVPFVSFRLFDAPTRDVCTVRRDCTTTPLQALALWNDRNFAEAARGLAQRLLATSGSDAARIDRAFGWCTQRQPSPAEQRVLLELLAAQRLRFASDPASATAAIGVGDLAAPKDVDAVELAAWSALAAVLQNLDEVLVRS